MPEMLSDVGYATGMFGKWHLGDTEGRFPTDQGFDEWYGIPNSTDDSFWPGQPQFERVAKEKIHPSVAPRHRLDGSSPLEPSPWILFPSLYPPVLGNSWAALSGAAVTTLCTS